MFSAAYQTSTRQTQLHFGKASFIKFKIQLFLLDRRSYSSSICITATEMGRKHQLKIESGFRVDIWRTVTITSSSKRKPRSPGWNDKQQAYFSSLYISPTLSETTLERTRALSGHPVWPSCYRQINLTLPPMKQAYPGNL